MRRCRRRFSYGTSENWLASLNILSTILVSGINFFTIPVFTRLLSVEDFGLVSIYVTWVQIFTIFVGLQTAGSIGTASAQLPDEEQDSYQFSVLAMSLVWFLIVLLSFLLFSSRIASALELRPLLIILLLFHSFGAFCISFFNMRFIFKKEAFKNFLLSVAIVATTTVLSIALIFLWKEGQGPLLGRVVGLAAPNILMGGILFLWLLSRREAQFSFRYWKFCLPLCLPLVVHNTSNLLLSQADKLLLQQLTLPTVVGVYSLGVTFAHLLMSIWSALNNAFVPFFYDDLKREDSHRIDKRIDNYMIVFTGITACFVMVSPEIIKLMTSEEYWGAVELIPILSIGCYCVFLYSFPVNYEFYLKKTGSIAIGTAAAATFNIVINLRLIPLLGAMGAAIGTSAAYILLFLFHFLIARYLYQDRNYPFWKYLIGLVTVLVVCGLYYLLLPLVAVRIVFACLSLTIVVRNVLVKRTIF